MQFTDNEGAVFVCNDAVAEALNSVPMGDGVDTAFFFARELEEVKSKSYDVKYADLPFRRVFPISNTGGPGVRSITYVTYDQAGMAAFIGAYANDLPRADVGGKETTTPVRDCGISFGWSQGEIRAAAKAGKPLQSRKASAANRGVEQLLNNVAFFGDAAHGLLGFFTHPNIPTGDVINGAGGNPEFSAKTPDEILFDMNDMTNDVFSDTLMVESINFIGMPPAQYTLIKSTARSATSETTILEYYKRNNPGVEVMPINECAGAGTAGVDVMFGMDRNPDNIEFEEPMPLIYHPEQMKGLEVLVPGEASTGGLVVRYPLACIIREKI